MEILSDPMPDLLAMPRFVDGAIDMRELLRCLAEQFMNSMMAEMHDMAIMKGASGCHDWAELEKNVRMMVESSLELAVRVEPGQGNDRFRIPDTGGKEPVTPTFATLPEDGGLE